MIEMTTQRYLIILIVSMATKRASSFKADRTVGMRRGTWTAEEDQVIIDCIQEVSN